MSKKLDEEIALVESLAEAKMPGFNTPTSEEAAKSMVDAAASLRGRIYWQLRQNGGKTSQEIARALHLKHNGVWQRMSELRRKGVVQDSGIRRRNISNRLAVVWEVRHQEGLDPILIEEDKGSKETLRQEISRLKRELLHSQTLSSLPCPRCSTRKEL